MVSALKFSKGWGGGKISEFMLQGQSSWGAGTGGPLHSFQLSRDFMYLLSYFNLQEDIYCTRLHLRNIFVETIKEK